MCRNPSVSFFFFSFKIDWEFKVVRLRSIKSFFRTKMLFKKIYENFWSGSNKSFFFVCVHCQVLLKKIIRNFISFLNWKTEKYCSFRKLYFWLSILCLQFWSNKIYYQFHTFKFPKDIITQISSLIIVNFLIIIDNEPIASTIYVTILSTNSKWLIILLEVTVTYISNTSACHFNINDVIIFIFFYFLKTNK